MGEWASLNCAWESWPLGVPRWPDWGGVGKQMGSEPLSWGEAGRGLLTCYVSRFSLQAWPALVGLPSPCGQVHSLNSDSSSSLMACILDKEWTQSRAHPRPPVLLDPDIWSPPASL